MPALRGGGHQMLTETEIYFLPKNHSCEIEANVCL